MSLDFYDKFINITLYKSQSDVNNVATLLTNSVSISCSPNGYKPQISLTGNLIPGTASNVETNLMLEMAGV